MNSPVSEARTTPYLAGLLTREETAAFERDLAASSPDEKEIFAQLNDTAALIVLASIKRHRAPASARAAVMAGAGLAETAAPVPGADYTYLMNDEGWQPSPATGVRIKPLFTNRKGGHRVFLLEIQPGVHLPEHPHQGYEECLVLRGDLVNEGQRLGPGDYVRAAGGTMHHELYSETGCLCVVIASAA